MSGAPDPASDVRQLRAHPLLVHLDATHLRPRFLVVVLPTLPTVLPLVTPAQAHLWWTSCCIEPSPVASSSASLSCELELTPNAYLALQHPLHGAVSPSQVRLQLPQCHPQAEVGAKEMRRVLVVLGRPIGHSLPALWRVALPPPLLRRWKRTPCGTVCSHAERLEAAPAPLLLQEVAMAKEELESAQRHQAALQVMLGLPAVVLRRPLLPLEACLLMNVSSASPSASVASLQHPLPLLGLLDS
mmetsp:Transcript_21605/g.50441  ORF Transcript_21605/g.50441 Transcript_21605/m.50441 type:complete len:244 (+) Transcript_21605:1133-1864(+)